MNTPKDPERARRESIITSAKSGANAWTRAQLAEWGVPWPPPPGWKDTLVRYGFPYQPDHNSRQLKRGETR